MELGAQVVHGSRNPVWAHLARDHSEYRAGAATVRTAGARRPMGALLADAPPWLVEQRLIATAKAGGTVAGWLHGQQLSPAALLTAAEWLRQGWAGEPAELSAAGVAAVRRAQRWGEGQHVVDGGLDALPAALAAGLEIRTSTPVRSVAWRPGAATVDGLAARAVVVTAPPPVLAAGRLRIDPWPQRKRATAAALRLGDACCAALTFDRPAPRNEVCFDADGEAGFARATAGRRQVSLVAKAAAAGRLRAALRTPAATAQLLGELLPWTAGGRVCEVVVADWGRDELACGAFSYPRAGAEHAPRRWAEPLGDTVFFAGEATADDDQPATVHGAVASGERAAREVVKAVS